MNYDDLEFNCFVHVRSSIALGYVTLGTRTLHICNFRPWFAYSLCNFYGFRWMLRAINRPAVLLQSKIL